MPRVNSPSNVLPLSVALFCYLFAGVAYVKFDQFTELVRDVRLAYLSLAVAIFVGGFFIVFPAARLVGAITGNLLLFRNRTAVKEPNFSLPATFRQRREFERAEIEYLKICSEFPSYERTFIELIEMYVMDSRDPTAARGIMDRARQQFSKNSEKLARVEYAYKASIESAEERKLKPKEKLKLKRYDV